MLLLLCSFTPAYASEYKDMTWEELIPRSELDMISKMLEQSRNPHGARIDPEQDLASQIDELVTQAEDPDYQGLMRSIGTRPELNQVNVRLPGYVVPLEINEDNAITEFFLVPYFGACIHVPPPPPNQIIFVRYEQGLEVEEIWMPFFVKGTLYTELLENDMATAAYTMVATQVAEYSVKRD